MKEDGTGFLVSEIGDDGSGEWHERDEEKPEDVDPEKGAIRLLHEMKKPVMIKPENRQEHETEGKHFQMRPQGF